MRYSNKSGFFLNNSRFRKEGVFMTDGVGVSASELIFFKFLVNTTTSQVQMQFMEWKFKQLSEAA